MNPFSTIAARDSAAQTSDTGYIVDHEQALMDELAQAEVALRAMDGGANPELVREAERYMLETAEELDRVQTAKRGMQSRYLGRFVKCLTCGNPFHDEGSYLAHWGYVGGRLFCERTISVLKVKGFVADEHTLEGWPEPLYVLRNPKHAR